jgi:hypothetical protein
MDIRLLAPTATTIGVLVSILLWHLNQRRKAVSYTVMRHHPLLNLSGAARNDMDIRFAGHSISDAYLIVIRIINTGHLPIAVSDYQTALSVLLNPGANIVAASIIETTPVDLEERVKHEDKSKSLIQEIEGEKVTLTPVLLNDGDSITVQMLARNAMGGVSVRGHVQGIKRINQWHESRIWSKFLIQLGAFIMAFAMLGVQPSELLAFQLLRVLPWMLVFVLGLMLLNAGIYWPRTSELPEIRVA